MFDLELHKTPKSDHSVCSSLMTTREATAIWYSDAAAVGQGRCGVCLPHAAGVKGRRLRLMQTGGEEDELSANMLLRCPSLFSFLSGISLVRHGHSKDEGHGTNSFGPY